MKQMVQIAMLSFFLVLAASQAMADELFIYPTKGQSQEQIEKDKYNCYQWAKQKSGFDPMAQPKATAPPPKKQSAKGEVVKGAAVGAIAGGIIDGSDGAGKGAAVGALAGGVRKRKQVRKGAEKQKQWEQEQAANYQKTRDKYNRAYGACLEGKGYTVK